MSPSPALIAWKAIRVVCAEEAQKRLIVAAGVASRPSSVATTLGHVGAVPAGGLGAAEVEVLDEARVERRAPCRGRPG